MTDPDLQAVGIGIEADSCRHPDDGIRKIRARAALARVASRLERAEEIETAASKVIQDADSVSRSASKVRLVDLSLTMDESLRSLDAALSFPESPQGAQDPGGTGLSPSVPTSPAREAEA